MFFELRTAAAVTWTSLDDLEDDNTDVARVDSNLGPEEPLHQFSTSCPTKQADIRGSDAVAGYAAESVARTAGISSTSRYYTAGCAAAETAAADAAVEYSKVADDNAHSTSR